MITEKYFQYIFKVSPLPSLLLLPDAPNFTIAEVNNAYLNFTGNKEPELIGKNIFEVFPKNHEEKNTGGNINLRQSLLAVIRTGTTQKMTAWKYDFPIRDAETKETRYVDIENVPVLDENKKVICIIQTMQVVNAPILLEQKQRESEKKYKYLFENNPSPMFIWDFETLQIIDCNEEALLKYGYLREEFLQLTLRDIRPEEDIPLINEATKNETSYSKIHKKIWRHKKKNGEIIFMELSGHLIDYNGRRSSFVQLNDVTEKLKAERELKESEERYKLLFYKSPMSKWIYELDTLKILEVNETAIAHYGYSREEFLSMTVNDIKPKEDLPKMQGIRESIKTQEGLIHFGIFTQLKKDKSRIKAEVSGNKFSYLNRDCMMVECNDVTEREKALHQLQDNEAKLLSAQKIAKLGYWQLLPDLVNLYWSAEVYNIWGVNKETFNLTRESFLKTIHPDDIEAFNKEINTVFATGKEHDIEHRIILPDGSVKWVHEKGKLLKDKNGILNIFEGTVQDITAEKLLAISLEESNKRYNYVTKATSDAIWDWDLVTDQLYLGEGFQTIFGYKTGLQPDSKSWADHIHPEDYDSVINEEKKLLNSTQLNSLNEYRFQKADHSYAYVLDRGIIIRDKNGKAVRMVGAIQDITKRKEEEQRLKLLESVITNTTDAVIITEAEPFDEPGQRIIYVNEAFTVMTGYTADEVIGKTPRILQGPKSDRNELKRLKKAMKNWQPCEITTINYKKNGEEFWINFSVSPVADEKGWFTHWIAIEKDVTQRKNEELQKALMAEISLLFNRAGPLQDILQQVLEKLLTFGNFYLAEAWLIGSDQNKINLIAKLPQEKEINEFNKDSAEVKSLVKGEGLPGITWKKKTAQLWRNIDKNQNFAGQKTAINQGLQTAYSLPLIYNDQLIGVLVLGLNRDEETLENIIPMYESFGPQLSAEIKRKQLEEQLNRIFDFAPDVICIAGTDGYFKKINPAACELLEYTEEELLVSPFTKFVHPDDTEKTVYEIQHLRTRNPTSYFENRYITKSGKIKWFAWTSTPSPEEGLIFAVAKDITEKKYLEVLLNKSNKLAAIGSWEIDVVKGSVYWSDITKEIREADLDFDPDLSTGMNYFKEGNSRETIFKIVQECIENGTPWDEELQIVTQKGNLKWIRTIGEAEIVNGKCIKVYGSFQDIDERKKTEKAILLSNERYTIVSRVTNDSIWDWDLLKNEVVRPDKTLENLLGYQDISPQEVDDFWKIHVHPEDWKRITEQRNILFRNPMENYWEDEYRFLKNDGQFAYIYDRGYIIRDDNGKAIRMIGASRDITKLKESEVQLKALNEQLQKRAKELAVSNAELEQFAYIASHDLQEPLRMVTSFLTQIEKKYGNIIDDKGKQYIHFAVDGAKRMRQIILDLLEFSRIGKAEDRNEEVDLNELINEIISLHRKQIQEKKAVIKFSKLPTLKTSKTPMRQVFQNLISNSLKYNISTAGTVPEIAISAKSTKSHWFFSVKDNGIGIDSQYFEKIFIIFQRLHNKDEFSGTGMGLAITKKIIESMGGKIWVESEEGKGSTFYFTIEKNIKTAI